MMKIIKNDLSNACFVTAGIIIFSIAALASAFTAQYGFDLQPCDLCLYQRIPYAITIVLGLAGLILSRKEKKDKATAFIIFICGLVFLAGAGIAFYHHGVEQHWWTSFLEGCKINFGGDDFLAQIENTAAVRCDEIPWADPVLGWSMAAWNSLVSTGLAAVSIVASILIIRKANGF